MSTAPNWIEVSAEALTANYHAIQRAAGSETEVLAVIKARAYGHGAELCAPMLVRAGARWLGVTCAAEGERVRQTLTVAGLDANILVMCGSLPEDRPALIRARLTPVVWTEDQVNALVGSGLPVHVEVDTGMCRQGVRPGAELARLLDQIRYAGLGFDGLLTHFASAEEAGSTLTLRQQQLFSAAVAELDQAPRWLHAGNSSAVDNPAEPHPWLTALAASVGARTMVRTGLALYGYCLPIESTAEMAAEPQVRPALQPALTWLARVLAVRELAPGETVGYNATYTARRPMRVALLPVGYADGLRRELSSTNERVGGWVMLAGRPEPIAAPILGRVSMNLTVVDVTGLGEVRAGDVATVLGPGITADDHARLAGTIAYEILCGLHPCA